MNKKIIVNADDFGVVPSVNAAITEAVLAGKVNSTAAFSNYEHSVEYATELARRAQEAGKHLDIGAHLTISSGKPVLAETADPKWGLCDDKGNFKSFKELSNKDIDASILKKELTAQIERFTQNGIAVKHLSCHHNTLTCFDKLLQVYVSVAREQGVKMRSVNIQPVKKNNLYVKLYLGMKLRDDNTDEDMRAMRDLCNNMQTTFDSYSGAEVKTPGYLESAYYGPLPMVAIRESALQKQVSDKKADLQEIVQRFGQSTHDSMELMVHLRNGGVSLWENYRKEVEDTGYVGIDPTYFDSRVVEFQSLMESDLTGLFNSNGAAYGSWNEL